MSPNNQNLKRLIKEIFNENRQCYGYRRIRMALNRKEIVASEKVIRRLMKSEHLRVYVPRIKRFSSYQGEISPDVPNLLQRNFHADKLNQKWLTDITEFSIPSGKVYLSPVIDYLFVWMDCLSLGRWEHIRMSNYAIESDGSAKTRSTSH